MSTISALTHKTVKEIINCLQQELRLKSHRLNPLEASLRLFLQGLLSAVPVSRSHPDALYFAWLSSWLAAWWWNQAIRTTRLKNPPLNSSQCSQSLLLRTDHIAGANTCGCLVGKDHPQQNIKKKKKRVAKYIYSFIIIFPN